MNISESYSLLSTNVKIGYSLSGKYIIVTDGVFSIYDDLDEFLNVYKSHLLRVLNK